MDKWEVEFMDPGFGGFLQSLEKRRLHRELTLLWCVNGPAAPVTANHNA